MATIGQYGQKTSLDELDELIKDKSSWIELFRSEIARTYIGNPQIVDGLLIGLLGNGHILLEGLPGLGKTIIINTIAKLFKLKFKRVQFTPDLLPSDIIGTIIYNPTTGSFTTKYGPIFTNILLADEINRAPSKVQSALLEGMQERQITLGENTYNLDNPFLVLATQNPIDQEGTYTLPEAQVDRFMLKLNVGYPSEEDELKILKLTTNIQPEQTLGGLFSVKEIFDSRKVINKIYVDEKIQKYIIKLVFATRFPEQYNIKLDGMIKYGVSSRATTSLMISSKILAFLNKRGYVVPQDIKNIIHSVFGHRIGLSYEAEAEGITKDQIIETILDNVPIP